MVIGLAAALLAAVLFGVAAVVQAVAARRHGLVSWLMVLVGATYLVGWGLHLVAIGRLPLYVAQVGIAVSLVVTALIAAGVVGEPLGRRHWIAIVAMVVGLAILVATSGHVGHGVFTTGRTLGLYGGFVVTLVLGLVALRMRDARGGAVLGALGGIAYGVSPVATRSLIHPRLDAETIVPALTIGLYGVLGFWLYSKALQRTSVTAATAPLVLLETLVPAVIGLAVFVMSTAGAVVLCGAEARLEHLETPHLEAESEHQPL
jgi:drug/metabolite transporter (DMT)-like permease